MVKIMTKVSLKEILTKLLDNKSMIDRFYPVGSYYETSDTSFNPNVSWGGRWVLETEGKVHIGAGSTYTVGNTGGSADAIVPYHRHSVDAITSGAPSNNTSGTPSNNTSGAMSGNTTHTHPDAPGFHWMEFSNSNRIDQTVGMTTSMSSGTYFFNSKANTGNNTTIAHTHSLQNHTHSLQNHTHSVGAHNTNYTGTSGNTVGANMPPYIVVNRWHRTA